MTSGHITHGYFVYSWVVAARALDTHEGVTHSWWHREGKVGAPRQVAEAAGWKDAEALGQWVRVVRRFRDGHTEAGRALDVHAGPCGPDRARDLVPGDEPAGPRVCTGGIDMTRARQTWRERMALVIYRGIDLWRFGMSALQGRHRVAVHVLAINRTQPSWLSTMRAVVATLYPSATTLSLSPR
jgi:hypothetical protein